MKKYLDNQKILFQSHIEAEKIRVSRIMCLLGSLLYIIFGIVDIFSLTSSVTEVLSIRGSVILIVMTCYWTTFQSFFIRYYNLILSIAYLTAAFGVEAMIYLALPEDHASNVYFAGLILVIMIVFAWSYFKLEVSLFVVSIIMGTYLYVETMNGMRATEYLINIFFLLSAGAIGFVSQLIRDRYVRENFFLQQSLSKALDEKTEEAEGNAYLANHDALTGLANRRYVTEKLEESLEVAKAKDKLLIILFIDLNGFKLINDVYGHAVGDEVLIITARRLELAIRRDDCLSRLGGDEYLIGLQVAKENLSEVEHMVQKYDTIISEPIKIDGVKLQVGASIGVAAYPIHGNNIKVLMDIADKKMYQVKRGKKSGSTDDSREKMKNDAVVMFPGRTKR